MDKKREARRERPGKPNTRPTIGLLCIMLNSEYSIGMWSGVRDAAREQGVNLVYFAGGQQGLPRDPYIDLLQACVIYDLATPKTLDGLLIWGSQLSHYVGLDKVKIFIEQYRPLPLLNIGPALEGIPSLTVDRSYLIHDALVHLIQAHGRRRIAFLEGPESVSGDRSRYHSYVDTLAEYGIPLDLTLVATGREIYERRRNSRAFRWRDAIRVLIDDRQLRPGIDFEAIIGSDQMVIDAMNELRDRGVQVPYDVAVIGQGDIQESQFAPSPLTTMRTSAYDLGRQAVGILLAQMDGEHTPDLISIRSKLVVRQSCGCLDPAVAQAAPGSAELSSEKVEADLGSQREAVLFEMRQALGSLAEALDPAWAERLLDAFVAEAPGDFLSALSDSLRRVAMAGGDVMVWHGVISALHGLSMPYRDGESLSRARDLWHQARVKIGETAQRGQVYHALQAKQQAQILRDVGQALISTFDVERLMEVLADGLPRLGIPSAYLALYEDPAASDGWARLSLAYSQAGRVELEPDGQRFLALQLAPKGMWPPDDARGPWSFVAQPLFFRETQLGFALFEVGPLDGNVYEVLRREISSALQGALIVRQRQQALEEIERANIEIQKLNEQLEAENLRMAAELDVARRLQQMLLPAAEELRQIEGLDIAGFMQPADEVGGDYYDVLKHKDSVKISMGDVTGRGLESGVLILMLQTVMRLLQTLELDDPVRFFDALNCLLLANMGRMKAEKGVTLALLDFAMGRLRLSGQHEQLIVVRASGQVELKDALDLGSPLGLKQKLTPFAGETVIDLQYGDGVVLYSDGITEAENEAGDSYGLERLCEVARTHWAKPAEAIKEAVVTDVRAFIGQQKVYDDLTLLVVKQK
jgi:sigma-B regulation protein RsbU (phosphoserine phosphatase)